MTRAQCVRFVESLTVEEFVRLQLWSADARGDREYLARVAEWARLRDRAPRPLKAGAQ